MKTGLRKALVVLITLALVLGMSVPAFAVIAATGTLTVEGDRLLDRRVTAIRMFDVAVTGDQAAGQPGEGVIDLADTGLTYTLVAPWLEFFQSTTIMVDGEVISDLVIAAATDLPTSSVPANAAAIDSEDVVAYINSLTRRPYLGELSALSDQAKIWALDVGYADLATEDQTVTDLVSFYDPNNPNADPDITMTNLFENGIADVDNDGDVDADDATAGNGVGYDLGENPTQRARFTFQNLTTGYYLVFPDTAPVDGEGLSETRGGVNAMLVHVPGNQTLKSAFPTVSKSVAREYDDPSTTYNDTTTYLENMAGAQIGEVLTYKLTTVLPITADMTEYALTISDKLPRELELLDSTIGSYDDPVVMVDGVEADGGWLNLNIGVNVLPGLEVAAAIDGNIVADTDYAYVRNTLDVPGLLTDATGNLITFLGDTLGIGGSPQDLELPLDTAPQDAFVIRFPDIVTNPGVTQDGSVLVEVFYKARVNSLAEVFDPMTNTALIEYDEGAGPETSAPETFDTYTYALDIQKRGDGEALNTATFVLSKDGVNNPVTSLPAANTGIIGMASTAEIKAALGGFGLVDVDALPDLDGTYTVAEGDDSLLSNLLPGVETLIGDVVDGIPIVNLIPIETIISSLLGGLAPDWLDLNLELFNDPTQARPTADDGSLRFEGLGAGTYYLWEMATGNPDYALPTYPVEIVIKPTVVDGVEDYSKPLYYVDTNGDGDPETAYNGVDGSTITFTVYNYKDTDTLPETGGVGTVGLTILGVAIIAGGVVFTSRRSRKNKQ